MNISYVVRVEGPEPTWVKWDANTGLPTFTFKRQPGMPRSEAVALLDRARITCGGTLRLQRIIEIG